MLLTLNLFCTIVSTGQADTLTLNKKKKNHLISIYLG